MSNDFFSAEWSVSKETHTRLAWDSQPVYQVQLVRGLTGGEEALLWLVVRGWSPDLRPGDLVMSVTGHYHHGLQSQSTWLTQFIAEQPKHITVAGWTVQHKYYLL